jgi:anti-anti-sigma regulatory factor
MLRITILETPSEQKWVLQGRLIGPWAAELKSNWDKTHEENGRSCVVDVSQVTFIDTSGEKVLRKMMRQGAHFVGCGLYATQVVENLKNEIR